MAWIWHCCGCGVGQWLGSDLIPSLGTSICCGRGPKKLYIYISENYLLLLANNEANNYHIIKPYVLNILLVGIFRGQK